MLTDKRSRGGALLSVMWLVAALSAIAFSVANTVRGEIERSMTATDGAKAYFLARGALDRALLWMQWGESHRNPDGSVRYWAPGIRRLAFQFPTGVADVEFIPESSKLNVNTARPLELMRLLTFLGVDAERAQAITAAILDWREPKPGLTEFDQYYLTLAPSFRARHASFEEIEELMLVRGMTPELFHGTFQRDRDGKLLPIPGLKDCLSVYSNGDVVDANSSQPAVLAAIGMPPDAIAMLVQIRRQVSIGSTDQLRMLAPQLGPALGRLTGQSGSIVMLRATARSKVQNGQLSDLKRSVAMLVKFAPATKDAYYHVLRWYDEGGLRAEDLR